MRRRATNTRGDLLDLFVHKENVITEFVFASLLRADLPPVREDGYLGYVTLILVAIGLISSGFRRSSLVWLVILLTFVLLKLGSTLTINGQTYSDIFMPKRFLNNAFPPLFRAFWVTAYLHVGILLPLSILAVRGLRRLLDAFPAKHGRLIIIVCLALNLGETIEPPDSAIIPADRLNYIDWLRTEGGQA